MAFSLNEKSMYFIDSPTKNVWKFKYDRKTGNISDREAFYHVEGEGVPDGMAMVSEGRRSHHFHFNVSETICLPSDAIID